MEAVQSWRHGELLVELHKERRQEGKPRSSKGEGWWSAMVNGDDATIHQKEKSKEEALCKENSRCRGTMK
jgi:hypothetical protein